MRSAKVRVFLYVLMIALVRLPSAHAQTARPEQALESLLTALKPYIVDEIPRPLYERSQDWGRQSMSFHGVRWKGIKPRVVKVPRNDGTWRKYRLDVRSWPQALVMRVSDFRQVDAERHTFRIYLSCLADVTGEQQNWENGIRLYSGSLRARFRLHAYLDCENTVTLDTSGTLPDVVLRLRVTKASVTYDEFVVEHIGGIGGAGAKILGDMLHDTINQWRPSLERRLLERVGASIVRAADTKEVRLGFSRFVTK